MFLVSAFAPHSLNGNPSPASWWRAFRADVVRAGGGGERESFVDESAGLSPEFDAMWRDNDVRSYGEGSKHLRHTVAACSRWSTRPSPSTAGPISPW